MKAWMLRSERPRLLTYCRSPDSAQTSGTAGRCHSSGSWVCTCLEEIRREGTASFLGYGLGLWARLTCRQDELPILGHFDGGGHSGHLKVLDELDPALDVWRETSLQKRLNIRPIIQSVVLKKTNICLTYRHLSSVTVFSSDLTATVTKGQRSVWFCTKMTNLIKAIYDRKCVVVFHLVKRKLKGPGLRCAVETNGAADLWGWASLSTSC